MKFSLWPPGSTHSRIWQCKFQLGAPMSAPPMLLYAHGRGQQRRSRTSVRRRCLSLCPHPDAACGFGYCISYLRRCCCRPLLLYSLNHSCCCYFSQLTARSILPLPVYRHSIEQQYTLGEVGSAGPRSTCLLNGVLPLHLLAATAHPALVPAEWRLRKDAAPFPPVFTRTMAIIFFGAAAF